MYLERADPAFLTTLVVLILQGTVENYPCNPFLGHVGLCGTVCKTIFPNVSLIGVYEADRQLHCWCIDNNGGDQENGLSIR